MFALLSHDEEIIQKSLKALLDDLVDAENGPDRDTFGFKHRLKEIYDSLAELELMIHAVHPELGEFSGLGSGSFESDHYTRGDSGMAQLLKSTIKSYMIRTEGNFEKEENSKTTDGYENKFSSKLKLHSKIVNASKKLFYDGHYSQAIFEAIKILEKEIKEKSSIRDKVGVDLVNHVFNKEHPIIKIVEGEEQEHIDEREGFRFLYMGTFLGIKNPKSHSIQNLNEPDKALEYLSFISLLMKRLDESTT